MIGLIPSRRGFRSLSSLGIIPMRTWLVSGSLAGVLFLIAPPLASSRSAIHWVSEDRSGRLVYRSLPRGDRIVDFSYAGYGAGCVLLPRVRAAVTLSPSGGDDSAAIQHAIDQVSSLRLQDDTRGAVVLGPGTFHASATLRIEASGVVLRGSGTGPAGTTLELTGEPHLAVAVGGQEQIQPVGTVAHIAEGYVPSGAQSIAVDNTSEIAPGDTIRITRGVTSAWLHFMGMDHMARNGKPETWVGNSISTLRTITAREGNVLRLDVALTDSYDRQYLPPEGAAVSRVLVTGRIEQDGIEDMHIVAPARTVALSAPLFRAIRFDDLRDGWARNLLIDDTTEGVEAGGGASRVTIEDVSIRHTTAVTSPAKPADFSLSGTQILLLRCSSVGNNLFYVVTGARNQGPNVVLDSRFLGDGHVQPHQRWSTGLLIDNTQVPQGGIDMMNRGEMGSGHGWTMGWGVVWNSSAATLVIQNPPGSSNWSIGTSGLEETAPMKIYDGPHGNQGPDLPQGFIESPGQRVAPASLYRAQLRDRLGEIALQALNP